MTSYFHTLFGLALTTGWQKPFPLLSTQIVDTALCLLTSTWTIPHSNAERTFSLINKNKTPSRSSLHLDGTLSSLITVKTHIKKPLEWKPSTSILENAKKATRTNNTQHRKK